MVGEFHEHLLDVSRADLIIMGLADEVNLTFMRDIVQKTRTSTLFVRDSGTESALA